MISCDIRSEACKIWYHGDCVGITKAQGRRTVRNGEQYICPICLPFFSATSEVAEEGVEPVPSVTAQLPQFLSISSPSFEWNEVDGEFFVQEISSAYNILVHCRCNLFVVPFGRVGKAFVQELARLFAAYREG